MQGKALFLASVLLLAVPAWASAQTDRSAAEQFDPNQPFDDAAAKRFLRSLMDEVFDRLDDYVELRGGFVPDRHAGEQRGRLGLRFYPHGKSKSNEHVDAETWFRFSPDAKSGEWHFRIQPSTEPSDAI